MQKPKRTTSESKTGKSSKKKTTKTTAGRKSIASSSDDFDNESYSPEPEDDIRNDEFNRHTDDYFSAPGRASQRREGWGKYEGEDNRNYRNDYRSREHFNDREDHNNYRGERERFNDHSRDRYRDDLRNKRHPYESYQRFDDMNYRRAGDRDYDRRQGYYPQGMSNRPYDNDRYDNRRNDYRSPSGRYDEPDYMRDYGRFNNPRGYNNEPFDPYYEKGHNRSRESRDFYDRNERFEPGLGNRHFEKDTYRHPNYRPMDNRNSNYGDEELRSDSYQGDRSRDFQNDFEPTNESGKYRSSRRASSDEKSGNRSAENNTHTKNGNYKGRK